MDQAALLIQSRALGDPTRNAIFVEVRDAATPLTVAVLTENFGLNHNAVRQHLAKLVEAGLVVGEQVARSGRGRPATAYRAVPGIDERWGGAGPHEALSMLLIELIRGGEGPREVGRRAGRVMAAENGSGDDAPAVLESVARRLGFEPAREVTDYGEDVVLTRCPFVGPAGASPEIVCELHHGIAEGIAEVAGGARVQGLVVRPPGRAGCRIQVALS